MLEARFIINPAAGAGRTMKKWPYIMALMKSLGLRFEHELTEAPGHAMELARAAVKNGYSLVVAVGGDGTINEVANGLYQAGNTKDTRLGIINTGSGGDYIRTLGIPRTFKEACYRLMNHKKLAVDLGSVEYSKDGQQVKRLFVNFAGLGFDAEIVKATTSTFKALGGTPSYLLGLLTTLLFYRNREVSLVIDGRREEKRVCTIMMTNGKYGGGGMLVAPNANPSDGLLDVLTIGDLNKMDLLRSLPRIYKGTHLTHPKVTINRAMEIEIQTRQPMSLQVDGELLGETPARFSILPKALNVAV